MRAKAKPRWRCHRATTTKDSTEGLAATAGLRGHNEDAAGARLKPGISTPH